MRPADLSPENPYDLAWREYRRIWWRSAALTFSFFFLGTPLAAALVQILFPEAPLGLRFAAMAPFVGAAILAGQAPIRWRCPRCGKPFHAAKGWHNGLARRCLNCGLPKWAGHDPDRS